MCHNYIFLQTFNNPIRKCQTLRWDEISLDIHWAAFKINQCFAYLQTFETYALEQIFVTWDTLSWCGVGSMLMSWTFRDIKHSVDIFSLWTGAVNAVNFILPSSKLPINSVWISSTNKHGSLGQAVKISINPTIWSLKIALKLTNSLTEYFSWQESFSNLPENKRSVTSKKSRQPWANLQTQTMSGNGF